MFFRRAKALYDCEAEDPLELAFVEDEILYNGWYSTVKYTVRPVTDEASFSIVALIISGLPVFYHLIESHNWHYWKSFNIPSFNFDTSSMPDIV